MMNRILEKISWKTRRFHLKYQLFVLYLNDHDTWGFGIMTFTYNHKEYSMLSLNFRLPNKTHVRVLSLDWWDVLFLRNYLFKKWDDLDDNYMWNSKGLSKWQTTQLWFLDKIFN